MSRRKEPAIPNELLDQLLAGAAASAAFEQGGLLDSLKKALTGRVLILRLSDHDPCAQLRNPIDMMRHGWSMRLFQAWQHWSTTLS